MWSIKTSSIRATSRFTDQIVAKVSVVSVVGSTNPHGPERSTTTCQLHMRKFNDAAEIYIEPGAKAFPVIKDLMVDRSSLTASSKKAATSR